MADEQEVSAGFPTAGLDVTCEFGRQPVDTTPDNQNVRSYEPATGKSRGGSRAGLTRYVDERVVNANLIQHLCVLVDPQQPGLRADIDPEFPDPSTNNLRVRVPPGRRIRLGGSAISPFGNDDDAGTDDPISFVRIQNFLYNDAATADGTKTVTLSEAPAQGRLIVVIVTTESAKDQSFATQVGLRVSHMTTGTLNDYTQAGGDYSTALFTGPVTGWKYALEMSMWYRVVGSGDTDADIRFEIANGGGTGTNIRVTVIEYNHNGLAPLTAFVKNEADETASAQLTFPSLDLNNSPGQAVVGAFTGFSLGNTPTPSGYNGRSSGSTTTTSGTVFDKLNLDTATFQIDIPSAETGAFVAVAASFHT